MAVCRCPSKSWDVGPDGGVCRSCGDRVSAAEVRRLHAIARDERARVEAKFPKPSIDTEIHPAQVTLEEALGEGDAA